MTPEIEAAEYAGGYKIRFTLGDGTSGTLDLERELWGEVFEPLKDVAVFRQFSIHPELRTVCWPNGADFAPEFLYEATAHQGVRADA